MKLKAKRYTRMLMHYDKRNGDEWVGDDYLETDDVLELNLSDFTIEDECFCIDCYGDKGGYCLKKEKPESKEIELPKDIYPEKGMRVWMQEVTEAINSMRREDE